jgi:hypothetical protein
LDFCPLPSIGSRELLPAGLKKPFKWSAPWINRSKSSG